MVKFNLEINCVCAHKEWENFINSRLKPDKFEHPPNTNSLWKQKITRIWLEAHGSPN